VRQRLKLLELTSRTMGTRLRLLLIATACACRLRRVVASWRSMAACRSVGAPCTVGGSGARTSSAAAHSVAVRTSVASRARVAVAASPSACWARARAAYHVIWCSLVRHCASEAVALASS